MRLFLLFITSSLAFNYTFINAVTGHVSLNRTKQIMANFYHDHVYRPTRSGYVQIYSGSQMILNQIDMAQTDLIIQAIDQITINNATNCNWKEIFSQPFTNSRLLIMFLDSHWCGEEPYHKVGMLHMKHVIYPVMIGPHADMMDMYHIWGPCVRPGCAYGRDYLQYTE